jgi:lipid-A-disaccharide synthase
MNKALVIGMVAGEASGDILGATMIAALKSRLPHAKFVGIAGEKMQAAGMETWFPMEKLAVRGLVEVVRHIPEILSIRRALFQKMRQEKIDLFIGIDAPDFNLTLEKKLKSIGIKTLHCVSPSVWAWRQGRIETVRRAVSRILVLFPFERAIYENANIPVSYIGHPAGRRRADEATRRAARKTLNVSEDSPIIAMLPGSRASEINEHAALLFRAAAKLGEQFPNAKFFAPMVSEEAKRRFLMLRPEDTQNAKVTILTGAAEDVLRAADFGWVASGTATLEAMLAGCPHAVFYRAKPLSVWIIRKMIRLPYVGLPNILAGRFIVPELIQEDATPENLTNIALNMIENPKRLEDIKRKFDKISATLDEDVAKLSADAILSELGDRHP